MSEYIEEYNKRYDNYLQIISNNIQEILRAYLAEIPRVDRIYARAKDPDSFAKKSIRKNEDETPRYTRPLTEIQDIIGARVNVLFEEDVETVVNEVLNYIRKIEETEKKPESYSEFGYFGRHLILKLPSEAIPEEIKKEEAPVFFELQIKTLFQHAWAETNHDFGYKPDNELTSDHKRLLAFTSAQAWGADKIFLELLLDLEKIT